MSFVLLAMALLLAPQVNPANPQTSAVTQPKCNVSGTVLSAATGQPLRGAAVMLRRTGRQGNSTVSVATDAAGHFEAGNLEPGGYFLTASHAGYISMQYGQKEPHGPGRMLALHPGQTAHDISFQLLREAVITGHVYDENGEPLQRIQVRAMRYGYLRGTRQLLPSGFAMSDDRGKYRLFDLPPGKYYISAVPQPVDRNAPFTYGQSFYPGVADASQATPVTVRAGDEFPGIDLTLQRITAFHIRGRVVSPVSDARITGAFVQIIAHSGPNVSFGVGTRVRNGQGDFDVAKVRPGSYYLVARLPVNGKDFQALQPITVTDSDINGLRLVLAPGATLKGMIHADGKVDLSNARLFLRPRIRVSFGSHTNPEIKADGAFEFDGVPDGGYQLSVFGLPGNAYVKSAMLGGTDVLESGFEVTNGQVPGSELNISVSANGGSIGGAVVMDGKPFNHALVTLLPDDPAKLSSEWWFKSTYTDQDGRFELAGIRPGDYRLFAWEKIERGEELDPDFYRQLKDQGREVHVRPGAALNFQLKTISARQVQAAEAR